MVYNYYNRKGYLYTVSLLLLTFTFQVQLSSSFNIINVSPLTLPFASKSTLPSTSTSTSLNMISHGRSSPIASNNRDRSKRQERVGHVVRSEVASIISLGYQIKNQQTVIDEELRKRINVVNADVSPDLRQARITISIMRRKNEAREEEMYYDDDEDEDEEEYDEDEEEGDEEFDEEGDEEYDEEGDEEYDEEDEDIQLRMVFPENRSSGDSVVDRRRSYAWLVRNTKQIRHALSQRLKHMKSIPNLTFVLADVGAAVDVMNLIDKVSKGNYKRDDIGMISGSGSGVLEAVDDDDYEWFDDDEEDEWVDEEEEEEDQEGKESKNAKKD